MVTVDIFPNLLAMEFNRAEPRICSFDLVERACKDFRSSAHFEATEEELRGELVERILPWAAREHPPGGPCLNIFTLAGKW
jgi:hypothetical protein